MAVQPVSHSCSNTVIMLVVKKHAAYFVDLARCKSYKHKTTFLHAHNVHISHVHVHVFFNSSSNYMYICTKHQLVIPHQPFGPD